MKNFRLWGPAHFGVGWGGVVDAYWWPVYVWSVNVSSFSMVFAWECGVSKIWVL